MEAFADTIMWYIWAGFFMGLGIWAAEIFMTWWGNKVSAFMYEFRKQWKRQKEIQKRVEKMKKNG